MSHVAFHRSLAAVACLTLAAVLPLLGADDAPAGRQYALLVGVKSYKKGELKSLKYTENDVNDLADVLKDAGYKRVVVMTQAAAVDDQDLAPTGPNVREQLRSLLEDRKPGDTVLVAFSGHGVQFKGQDDHYFCPADARLADRNTLISLSEVYDALKGCKAEMKLLVVDACRADPQPDNKGPAKADLESVTRPQAERPPGGVAALFSCSEGQFAYESDDLKHGVFFHYLIEGMKGEAANKKGEVTLERLASYVKEEVPDRVKEQEGPSGRQLPHLVGDLVGEAPLATTGGGDMKETPYYPMRVGTTWRYKGTQTIYLINGQQETTTHDRVIRVVKHEKRGTTVCAQLAWTEDGKDFGPGYYCVKDDCVFDVGTDGDLHLMLNLRPKMGETWEVLNSLKEKVVYTEKEDQEVTVAGKTYTALVLTSERPGSFVRQTLSRYFVKGIGLMKEEEQIYEKRAEVFTLELKSHMELDKFEPGGK